MTLWYTNRMPLGLMTWCCAFKRLPRFHCSALVVQCSNVWWLPWLHLVASTTRNLKPRFSHVGEFYIDFIWFLQLGLTISWQSVELFFSPKISRCFANEKRLSDLSFRKLIAVDIKAHWSLGNWRAWCFLGATRAGQLTWDLTYTTPWSSWICKILDEYVGQYQVWLPFFVCLFLFWNPKGLS